MLLNGLFPVPMNFFLLPISMSPENGVEPLKPDGALPSKISDSLIFFSGLKLCSMKKAGLVCPLTKSSSSPPRRFRLREESSS